ncbi:MAG: hypothetical protein LBU83_13785 [Bacteroidales bacterium]|jgi:hypothetical protein|nr:hypothetical protein [Bacteroidales bacterium]
MKIATVKRQIRIKQWKEMVNSQQNSGLSIKKWCEINGLNRKTYYYRLYEIRNEILAETENQCSLTVPAKQPAVFTEYIPGEVSNNAMIIKSQDDSNDTYKLTIHIGRTDIHIKNGADLEMITTILRAVSVI